MSEDISVKEAAALLREWDQILILTHQYPDGDTLGPASPCAALCTGWENRPGGMQRLYSGEIRVSV